RSDYLSRFSAQFSPGGLRKLMDEGAFFPDCRMSASSFSSTGIATIATGAYPDAHGIVAESWYDMASKKVVTARSSLNQASTLADQIAVADSRNRVFATAPDHRRAAMLSQSAPFARIRHEVLAIDPTGASAEESVWLQLFR